MRIINTVDDLSDFEDSFVRMKEPLLSIGAQAGVTYPLWRFVNIYAETGLSYYFDNKSNVQTIRSDKPFNVSVQAGLRLGF